MIRFLAILVFVFPLLGCFGSVYLLGDYNSGQKIDQRLYLIDVPVVPGHGHDRWERSSKSLESDDVFLKSKWWFEPKKLSFFKAVVNVVNKRSTMKSVTDLQKYVQTGGLEGVQFPKSVKQNTSQPNLLCVRPSLYSEVRVKGHFVYLMVCVDIKTRIQYELALVEDVVNDDKSTPTPSSGFKAGADYFFESFRVK